MQRREFRDAVEDARGVMALFTAKPIAEDDCVPAVRDAMQKLDAVLDAALQRASSGELTDEDREAVETKTRDLLVLWDKCGGKTQAFMLDLKTIFGRYITLG